MKLLFASRRPAYPYFLGGAERSFYELAHALAEAGHQVVMIGECRLAAHGGQGPAFGSSGGSPGKDFYWDEEWGELGGRPAPRRLRLRVAGRPEILHTFLPDFRTLVTDVVRGFDPALVCTQLEGSTEVVEIGAAAGIQVVHFVRDTYHPFNFHVLSGLSTALRPAACIANSGYTAGFLKAELGIEAEVLYPIVRPPDAAAGPATALPAGRPRVLFGNPDPRKGGRLMHQVAAELADLTFVVLPGWGFEVPDSWRRLPNVEAHAWPVLEVERAYAAADLVVLPSQEGEGFGRMAIEGQACGRPVIASRHSALAEVLAGSAELVDDYRSPAAWTAAIRGLLADPGRRDALALAGLANAARFAPAAARARFEEIVAPLLAGRGT